MSSLAILILTKNEEDNIVDVVRNAKTCTDEVIIIDSGSTDRTVELAEREGAKVAFRAWDGDFSAQRNFALSQTEADWVLYVDADERITPALGAAIRDIVQHGALDKQYSVKRKSVAFGVTFNHGVLNPDHVLRMFPRNTVTWVHKVHEHPTIWAQDAYARGKRTSLGAVFGHSLGGFFKMFVLRKGFLDGLMGTYMCCNHFFYTMLKYLKLYELQRQGDKK